MLVLDTNHLAEFDRASSLGRNLRRRLKQAAENGEEIATTIICVEEQLRGWLAQIHRVRDAGKLIAIYQRLQGRIDFFAKWHVLPWDEGAVEQFNRLRDQRIRIGSMDLKIAAIALSHKSTLLTRNRRDFDKVPGLKVADWLG